MFPFLLSNSQLVVLTEAEPALAAKLLSTIAEGPALALLAMMRPARLPMVEALPRTLAQAALANVPLEDIHLHSLSVHTLQRVLTLMSDQQLLPAFEAASQDGRLSILQNIHPHRAAALVYTNPYTTDLLAKIEGAQGHEVFAAFLSLEDAKSEANPPSPSTPHHMVPQYDPLPPSLSQSPQRSTSPSPPSLPLPSSLPPPEFLDLPSYPNLSIAFDIPIPSDLSHPDYLVPSDLLSTMDLLSDSHNIAWGDEQVSGGGHLYPYTGEVPGTRSWCVPSSCPTLLDADVVFPAESIAAAHSFSPSSACQQMPTQITAVSLENPSCLEFAESLNREPLGAANQATSQSPRLPSSESPLPSTLPPLQPAPPLAPMSDESVPCSQALHSHTLRRLVPLIWALHDDGGKALVAHTLDKELPAPGGSSPPDVRAWERAANTLFDRLETTAQEPWRTKTQSMDQ